MKQIEIYVNGNWVGSGKIGEHGNITDCGAQFCSDNDDSLLIYDWIDIALADGDERVVIYTNGKTCDAEAYEGAERQVITWLIIGDEA